MYWMSQQSSTNTHCEVISIWDFPKENICHIALDHSVLLKQYEGPRVNEFAHFVTKMMVISLSSSSHRELQGVNTPSPICAGTHISARKLKTNRKAECRHTYTPGHSRRCLPWLGTQGDNQRALPWKSSPSLGERTSEAWVEVWRKRKAWKGGFPPLKDPFSCSQRDPSAVTHTHIWKHIMYTLLFSPGDRSSFLFHTHTGQYQYAYIVFDLR